VINLSKNISWQFSLCFFDFLYFRYQLPDNLSNAARVFIDACLTKDYHQRPTAEELIQDPFLNDIHTHSHHHHHEQQNQTSILF
jgi:serine/threonine protein kinase